MKTPQREGIRFLTKSLCTKANVKNSTIIRNSSIFFTDQRDHSSAFSFLLAHTAQGSRDVVVTKPKQLLPEAMAVFTSRALLPFSVRLIFIAVCFDCDFCWKMCSIASRQKKKKKTTSIINVVTSAMALYPKNHKSVKQDFINPTIMGMNDLSM